MNQGGATTLLPATALNGQMVFAQSDAARAMQLQQAKVVAGPNPGGATMLANGGQLMNGFDASGQQVSITLGAGNGGPTLLQAGAAQKLQGQLFSANAAGQLQVQMQGTGGGLSLNPGQVQARAGGAQVIQTAGGQRLIQIQATGELPVGTRIIPPRVPQQQLVTMNGQTMQVQARPAQGLTVPATASRLVPVSTMLQPVTLQQAQGPTFAVRPAGANAVRPAQPGLVFATPPPGTVIRPLIRVPPRLGTVSTYNPTTGLRSAQQAATALQQGTITTVQVPAGQQLVQTANGLQLAPATLRLSPAGNSAQAGTVLQKVTNSNGSITLIPTQQGAGQGQQVPSQTLQQQLLLAQLRAGSNPMTANGNGLVGGSIQLIQQQQQAGQQQRPTFVLSAPMGPNGQQQLLRLAPAGSVGAAAAAAAAAAGQGQQQGNSQQQQLLAMDRSQALARLMEAQQQQQQQQQRNGMVNLAMLGQGNPGSAPAVMGQQQGPSFLANMNGELPAARSLSAHPQQFLFDAQMGVRGVGDQQRMLSIPMMPMDGSGASSNGGMGGNNNSNNHPHATADNLLMDGNTHALRGSSPLPMGGGGAHGNNMNSGLGISLSADMYSMPGSDTSSDHGSNAMRGLGLGLGPKQQQQQQGHNGSNGGAAQQGQQEMLMEQQGGESAHLPTILMSIGVELARHGIRPEAAIAAGWLGALTPRDSALLNEAYAEEEARMLVEGQAMAAMHMQPHLQQQAGGHHGAHQHRAQSAGSNAASVPASEAGDARSTASPAGSVAGTGLTMDQLMALQDGSGGHNSHFSALAYTFFSPGDGGLAAEELLEPLDGSLEGGHGQGFHMGGNSQASSGHNMAPGEHWDRPAQAQAQHSGAQQQLRQGTGAADANEEGPAKKQEAPTNQEIAARFANLDLGCGFF